MVRLITASVGLVALLVGVLGLLTPVSVSPDLEVVSCGTAIAPDLSEARSQDDASAANVPIGDEVVTDTNYTRLCGMEIEDRRLWTIALAGVGALAVSAVGVQGLMASRQKSAH